MVLKPEVVEAARMQQAACSTLLAFCGPNTFRQVLPLDTILVLHERQLKAPEHVNLLEKAEVR
jgi:hypothetical protein